MEIYLGDDLGNLSEMDCQSIKSIMDGETYYNFNVSWSNYAGNCQLIISTDYPDKVDEEQVKNTFMHAYFSKTAYISRKARMMQVFCQSKAQRKERHVVIFESKHDWNFYFQDAEVIAGLFDMPPYKMSFGNTPEGYKFVRISKTESETVLERLDENCIKYYIEKIE